MLLVALAVFHVQSFEINCEFWRDTNNLDYVCEISSVSINMEDRRNITFGDKHLPGLSNHDVVAINIVYSEFPFIIPEMFLTFPNVRYLTIFNSKLQEIHQADFLNADCLENVLINGNNLKKISSAAFAGASNLRTLNIANNQIQTIDENAFVGLNHLEQLSFQNNEVREISLNIFRSLMRLQVVLIDSNNLKRLNGRILAYNPRVLIFYASGNKINAIGRTFPDFLFNIQHLNMLGNQCVSNFFLNTNSEAIRRGLVNCFNNYEDN